MADIKAAGESVEYIVGNIADEDEAKKLVD